MEITSRMPDGRYLAENSAFLQPGRAVTASIQRLPRPIVLISPSACDTIGLFPGPESRVIETRYRGRRGTQQVFVNYGRRTVAAAWDSLIAVGTDDAYQIDLIKEDGAVVQSFRIPWTTRPTPAGARSELVHRRLEQMHQARGEALVDPAESDRLIREGTLVADSLPPYTDLLVGTDHIPWVMDGWAPGLPERTALAFETDGTIRARLHLPAAFRPVAFGADRVLTRVEDPESGVIPFRVLRMMPEKR